MLHPEADSAHQITVVLGAQWGDEGKGKLVDVLAQDSDICARFNGGANAGHTLWVNNQKLAFHLLPCGMLNPNCKNLICHGVVVHVPTLLSEIRTLEERDPTALSRLFISDRAHILVDAFKFIDSQNESSRGENALGTTKRGIGPCYSTKAARIGLRFCDLKNWSRFSQKFCELNDKLREHYPNLPAYNDELKALEKARDLLMPRIADTLEVIDKAVVNKEKILVEGANATMLDLDFGTYPFVTSSSTTIGGICTGAGIHPRYINQVIGVVKAYTTRVGSGPFPTELSGELHDQLAQQGQEFGTTTGRPRRCGWLDVVQLNYAHRLNHFNCLNLSKLDVLTGLPTLRIGVAYKLNGEILKERQYPACLEDLDACEVIYEDLPGWSENIDQCRTWADLPANCLAYVKRVQSLLSCPIKFVGTGPHRHNLILNEE